MPMPRVSILMLEKVAISWQSPRPLKGANGGIFLAAKRDCISEWWQDRSSTWLLNWGMKVVHGLLPKMAGSAS